jgi:histidinol dehydrogenase
VRAARRRRPVPGGHLAAAAVAGVDEVYRIGGAQAIGALAYGTETIRAGRRDRRAGQRLRGAGQARGVAGPVGVPSAFAGPSEVVVVADATVPVDFAAIDVIVQAEHGPDGLAWLVTWDEAVADAVTAAVARLVPRRPAAAEIEATLAEGGYAVLVDGPEQAMAVANAIAPEHLELMTPTRGPGAARPPRRRRVLRAVGAPPRSATTWPGPATCCPPFGSARFAGALTVDDFLKHVHVVTVDEAGLAAGGDPRRGLADAEGLAAHAESVGLRLR